MSSSSRLGFSALTAAKATTMSKKPSPASAAVLYHYPCPDGAFAALAAHLYFSSYASASASAPTQPQPLFFPNTVYNPITPRDLSDHDIADLYLLDFVGPPGFVNDVASRVGRVVVLDHHKTALESSSLCGHNVTKVIDVQRSGATIAFDYFKAKVTNAKVLAEFDRVRQLFEYIEDGDLWQWRLPNSKAFSSGLNNLNIEFDVRLNPSLFEQLLSLDLDSVISQGKKSLAQKQILINEALSQSYEIALGDGRFGHCLAVDADSIAELRSELGHQLAIKSCSLDLRGIGAVVYRVPELKSDRLLKISLRSLESEDTTVVSEEFNGGGHRNASSFMLSTEEFRRWKVSKNA